MDSPYTFKLLKLAHIDLMGPTKTKNLGERHYIFLAVDDYSRFS